MLLIIQEVHKSNFNQCVTNLALDFGRAPSQPKNGLLEPILTRYVYVCLTGKGVVRLNSMNCFIKSR